MVAGVWVNARAQVFFLPPSSSIHSGTHKRPGIYLTGQTWFTRPVVMVKYSWRLSLIINAFLVRVIATVGGEEERAWRLQKIYCRCMIFFTLAVCVWLSVMLSANWRLTIPPNFTRKHFLYRGSMFLGFYWKNQLLPRISGFPRVDDWYKAILSSLYHSWYVFEVSGYSSISTLPCGIYSIVEPLSPSVCKCKGYSTNFHRMLGTCLTEFIKKGMVAKVVQPPPPLPPHYCCSVVVVLYITHCINFFLIRFLPSAVSYYSYWCSLWIYSHFFLTFPSH